MARLDYYRECIQTLLSEHGNFKSKQGDVENELIVDTTRDKRSLTAEAVSLSTDARRLERSQARLSQCYAF